MNRTAKNDLQTIRTEIISIIKKNGFYLLMLRRSHICLYAERQFLEPDGRRGARDNDVLQKYMRNRSYIGQTKAFRVMWGQRTNKQEQKKNKPRQN